MVSFGSFSFFVFQLETDETILAKKARKALELYQHKVSCQVQLCYDEQSTLRVLLYHFNMV